MFICFVVNEFYVVVIFRIKICIMNKISNFMKYSQGKVGYFFV